MNSSQTSWIAIIAVIISSCSFIVAFFTLAYNNFIIHNDLKARVIKINESTNNDGYLNVSILFSNRGNRAGMVNNISYYIKEESDEGFSGVSSTTDEIFIIEPRSIKLVNIKIITTSALNTIYVQGKGKSDCNILLAIVYHSIDAQGKLHHVATPFQAKLEIQGGVFIRSVSNDSQSIKVVNPVPPGSNTRYASSYQTSYLETSLFK